MHKLFTTAFFLALTFLLLLSAFPASAQWSAEPGTTVRNAFGPDSGGKANQCRGACGGGCPKSCARSASYECTNSNQLRKVSILECGTHPGCRVHDDCLDACLQLSGGASSNDCATQCDAGVVEYYGFASSASWATGGGPYDGNITFEYTLDAPDALEAAYVCPEGASRQCASSSGCVTADGKSVDPVFASYSGASAGAMQVSAFRSGPACSDSVCKQSTEIVITGEDSCPGGVCSRFGMEFDYRNADPSAPLECTTSTSGGDSDFIGDLLKAGADATVSRAGDPNATTNQDPQSQEGDGMAQLLGMFSKVLASGDAPEDIEISMVPFDENGNPIESQRVGSTPANGPPPIPHSIDLPSSSGHLFVPMYQLSNGLRPGQPKERRVRCTHKGAPVLETVFRLQAS